MLSTGANGRKKEAASCISSCPFAPVESFLVTVAKLTEYPSQGA